MNEYVEILKGHVAENPPNYGDGDAHFILEMLYTHYHECNNTDTDAVKVAFEDLYQRMHGMPLREIDRIVDAVCTLCREHKRAGFIEGIIHPLLSLYILHGKLLSLIKNIFFEVLL